MRNRSPQVGDPLLLATDARTFVRTGINGQGVNMGAAATSRLEVRLTAEAKERLALAAELADENPSEFVRRAAETRAEQVLSEHRETRVPPEFFDELLAALDQPAEPNEALTRAFARARQVVKRV